MKKLFFLLLIGVALFSSCDSDDDDTETLVGDWVTKYEIDGKARYNANTFIIGDKAYLMCGIGANNPYYLRDLWEYDPSTGAWIPKANFPAKYPDLTTIEIETDSISIPRRIDAVSFTIDSIGYYGLGYSETYDLLNDFWSYSPKLNKWKKLKDFEGTARRGAIGFAANGKGYIIGGDDGNVLNDQYQYDPITNEWIPIYGTAKFNGRKRKNGFTFTIGNKVYVGGGVNNGVYLNDFWEFNMDANTWTEKGKTNNNSGDSYDDDYTIPRQNGVTFVINGKGYVTSGSNGSLINDTWEFNPADGLWTQKTYFESTARNYASGFSVANRGFVLCGVNGSQYFSDIWEFKPLDGAE